MSSQLDLLIGKGDKLIEVHIRQLGGDHIRQRVVLQPVYQLVIDIAVDSAVDEIRHGLHRDAFVLRFGVGKTDLRQVGEVRLAFKLPLAVFVD